MDKAWEELASTAGDLLDPLWYDFAKQGKESAVFAPLGKYPRASAWLARSMASSDDYVTRKLGAMLAGWIEDGSQAGLLKEMLNHEREVFRQDSLSGNSVGEDIMFAATRWTESQNAAVKDAGIQVLVDMIRDALGDTPWNTVHWAVANLHHVTHGNHLVFGELADAPENKFEEQQFLRNAVVALKRDDMQSLGRYITAPSPLQVLQPDDVHSSRVQLLWSAAAAAEAALG
jgi:hypothetical protein